MLIPARNEAERIETTVRAALGSHHPVCEVLVYDDGSTDGTGQIVDRLAAQDPRVRRILGVDLPPGWVGKPHACHRLAEEASGAWLCFLDADTVLEPNGLGRAACIIERLRAGVLTAVPRQVMGTFSEQIVLPLLHLTYASWFPLPLVWKSSDPRFMAANGQLVVVERKVYRAFGGFERVRHEVVDDMAFCRAAKEAGHRVVFADGNRMAACRMYTCGREVWEGFSKNLYEGVGGRPTGLALALLLNLAAFLLPWVTLPLGAAYPSLLLPSAVGVSANLTQRLLLAQRFDHPWFTVATHPLSVLALVAIAINSWRWHVAGSIAWRGRIYGPRAEREGTA